MLRSDFSSQKADELWCMKKTVLVIEPGLSDPKAIQSANHYTAQHYTIDKLLCSGIQVPAACSLAYNYFR